MYIHLLWTVEFSANIKTLKNINHTHTLINTKTRTDFGVHFRARCKIRSRQSIRPMSNSADFTIFTLYLTKQLVLPPGKIESNWNCGKAPCISNFRFLFRLNADFDSQGFSSRVYSRIHTKITLDAIYVIISLRTFHSRFVRSKNHILIKMAIAKEK